MEKKVIVIGGGWSGIAAAVAAKKCGADVTIVEKTDLMLGLGNVGGIMRNNGRFTAVSYTHLYPVTFIVMFLAAFISGTLANRLKRSAEQSAQMAYRMKILFDTNQLFSGARDRDEVVGAAARQLKKLLNRDVVFYHMPENGFSGDGAELPEPLDVYKRQHLHRRRRQSADVCRSVQSEPCQR